MSTKLEIANMAASHLAIGETISDFDNDSSTTAVTMRRFYDQAFEQLLRSHEWPFAYKMAALSLAASNPNDDWLYSYTYPSDCLYLRWINQDYMKPPYQDDSLLHTIVYGTSGREIYTNVQSAIAGYTVNMASAGDEARLPEDCALALSYLLASLCAPMVTGGDHSQLIRDNRDLYMYYVGIAAANAVNEDGSLSEPDSELIRAR